MPEKEKITLATPPRIVDDEPTDGCDWLRERRNLEDPQERIKRERPQEETTPPLTPAIVAFLFFFFILRIHVVTASHDVAMGLPTFASGTIAQSRAPVLNT